MNCRLILSLCDRYSTGTVTENHLQTVFVFHDSLKVIFLSNYEIHALQIRYTVSASSFLLL